MEMPKRHDLAGRQGQHHGDELCQWHRPNRMEGDGTVTLWSSPQAQSMRRKHQTHPNRGKLNRTLDQSSPKLRRDQKQESLRHGPSPDKCKGTR